VPERLSAEEKAAYRALIRVVFATPRTVTADISRECGLGLSDYLVLESLSEAPDCRLRLGDVAAAHGVTLSGATRIMNRLDGEGLTRRLRHPGDARGTLAVLTADGQARLDDVHAAHLASVRRHIFDHLSDGDVACLTASLERIANSLQGAHP
jgi:DNA-binding MarR family transcriptional regulator